MTEYREVELDGEAFFKVTKSNHPFIVKTGKSFVKVYGTEFNVNNDPAGDVEVVLVNGSVGSTRITVKNYAFALTKNAIIIRPTIMSR